MLHELFSIFDDIAERQAVLKVETIGDAYVCGMGCVTGHPENPSANALAIARTALLMQRACSAQAAPDGSRLVMRVGLHVGPAVAGVVGDSMLK